MRLVRYNPLRELEDFPVGIRLFQDPVDRLFSEPASARPWTPNVDILENEDEIVLKADLPGLNEKEIDIRMESGTLTLKGERSFNKDEKQKGYHRIERGSGSFVRCFSLPETVDPDKVKAQYKAGVLTVALPKKEASKPRAIEVSIN